MKTTLNLLFILFLLTFSQQNFAQSGAQTENVEIKLAKEQSNRGYLMNCTIILI
ncbi:hypothetical protein [Flavobacterium geliluteum]|uniref:Uncharacterized protein n=1 Tax=Flavobacterium geliluteum TaxID=2816120 RepID=A0A941B4X5_9FLAO|nr:hypothetical protein [Flavobacterium geliluteum]MBP4139993.1 hypothetical protein [Flavobacterium geliluteum]